MAPRTSERATTRQLAVSVEPVGDSGPADRVYLPHVPLEVPFDPDAPLRHLPSRETRFCSYAASVYLEQGPPQLEQWLAAHIR